MSSVLCVFQGQRPVFLHSDGISKHDRFPGSVQYRCDARNDLRGNFFRYGFDELRPAFGPVEDASLIGEHHAIGFQAQTRERYRPALAAREVAAARDRAHHRKIEAVEGGR